MHVIAYRSVCSDGVVVTATELRDPPQVRLSYDNDMVEAFPSDRANQPFDATVLPWRATRDRLVLLSIARNRSLAMTPSIPCRSRINTLSHALSLGPGLPFPGGLAGVEQRCDSTVGFSMDFTINVSGFEFCHRHQSALCAASAWTECWSLVRHT
jgi:hypothetical protein